MSVAAADLPFRPVYLGDLTPADVAARLRHVGGLVFFDSALEKPGRTETSVIAAGPRQIIRGSLLKDAALLQDLLVKHDHATGIDDGLPHGFECGLQDVDLVNHPGLDKSNGEIQRCVSYFFGQKFSLLRT